MENARYSGSSINLLPNNDPEEMSQIAHAVRVLASPTRRAADIFSQRTSAEMAKKI
jgi:hypothetical protein